MRSRGAYKSQDCAECTGNTSILQDVLPGVGLPSSRDQVIHELAWRKEQGFASYNDRAECFMVTASGRSVEIARGIATHPEIQRPGPRG